MRRLLLISHLAVLAACSTTPAPIDGAADRAAVVEYSRAGAVDSVPDPAYQYFQGRRMAVWNQAGREIAFSKWDSVFRARVVKHAPTSRPLPAGAPIAAYAPGGAQAPVLQQYIAEHKVAGIIVLQDGKVRLERYALGHDANSRWTSQSVAKSVAGTLVGAAIKDGYIKSIDEPVTTYIPCLRESVYDSVSIRQLLTMTSGVKWNEDYTDTKADIALFYGTLFDPALGRTVSYMRKLPRANPAGSKWVYNTGEANLIGELVSQATGQSLAAYLSEKIWVPVGMELDATWAVGPDGREIAGCCLQAGLRDFARVGQFIPEGAAIDGKSIVPDGWISAATSKQADVNRPGIGYGYQWWTRDNGTFYAVGIHGQMIHVDPARRLVIAINSVWPVATGQAPTLAREAVLAGIASALDAENRQ